jgi:hypothetical protein
MAETWNFERRSGGIVIVHADGRLIATLHADSEPYAPQIAATPALYETLDNLTDITVCVDGPISDLTFIHDLHTATASALAVLAKARGETRDAM